MNNMIAVPKIELSKGEIDKLWNKIEKTSRERWTSGVSGRGRNRRWSNWITKRPAISTGSIIKYLVATGWDVKSAIDGYLGGKKSSSGVYVSGPVEYYSRVFSASKEIDGKLVVLDHYFGKGIRDTTDELVELKYCDDRIMKWVNKESIE